MLTLMQTLTHTPVGKDSSSEIKCSCATNGQNMMKVKVTSRKTRQKQIAPVHMARKWANGKWNIAANETLQQDINQTHYHTEAISIFQTLYTAFNLPSLFHPLKDSLCQVLNKPTILFYYILLCMKEHAKSYKCISFYSTYSEFAHGPEGKQCSS